MRTRTLRNGLNGLGCEQNLQVAAGMLVALLTLNGCTSEIKDTPSDVSVGALCTGVQLSRSPSTLAVTGTVTFTASNTTCAAGETPQYRFQYRQNSLNESGTTTGGGWTTVQNWSTSPTLVLNTNTLASG